MALPNILQIIERFRLYLVPGGFIGMWSGSAETIPTGWALCDGTNGTPNLTDRFVLGAGKAYQPGVTGGAATATPSVAAGSAKTLNIGTGAAGTGIGIQGTTLDGNTLPSHYHNFDGGRLNKMGMHDSAQGFMGADTQCTPYRQFIHNTGNSWAHAHGVSDPGHAHAVGSSEHSHGITDNGHTHTVTTSAHVHTVTDPGHTHTLTAQVLSTLPPYYALCFIMKL